MIFPVGNNNIEKAIDAWKEGLKEAAPVQRQLCAEINAEFMRLIIAPELINYGSAPMDGTGDPMLQALRKIRDNLRQINR